MFSRRDFYDTMKKNRVMVLYYDSPAIDSAFVVRCDGKCAVAINRNGFKNRRHFRTVAMHELGHIETGAFYKQDSDEIDIAREEYRADERAFQTYLSAEELAAAMKAGYTEPYQLAEYFDIDEEYILKSIHYWKECKGVDFNVLVG